MNDQATGFDAQESVLGRGIVKSSRLCVSEERVRPPDAFKHLITDAQLVTAVVETQPLVVPVLAKVEIYCKVLACATPTSDTSQKSYI